MRLLQVFNQYRSLFGGEETVVRRIAVLAEREGWEHRLVMRSSRGLDESLVRKAGMFFSGIYNPAAATEMAKIAADFRPDVAQVHNVYPLFSPSVVVALRNAGVPVVLMVHNHFLTCPKTDHLYQGRICERCVGGREFYCVGQNCRGQLMESIGYALRSWVARRFRLFVDNASVVIALSRFAADRLINCGFDPRRIEVLPNMVDRIPAGGEEHSGGYVMYCGRMSPQKGVPTLLEAARRRPEVPVVLVGSGRMLDDYRSGAPDNAEFLGQLDGEGVSHAYARARFLVVPSTCYEGCPLVVSEGMARGLPIVASRLAGLPELIEDGVDGLLFEPGDAGDLAQKIERLWKDPELCRRMGAAARDKARREFGADLYWLRLQEIYERARLIDRELGGATTG